MQVIADSTTAELMAIEAALAIRSKARPLPKATTIATDSKRAIRHILMATYPNGQYIVRYIRRHIEELYDHGVESVILQCTLAHKGIEGNEKANTAAKEITISPRT